MHGSEPRLGLRGRLFVQAEPQVHQTAAVVDQGTSVCGVGIEPLLPKALGTGELMALRGSPLLKGQCDPRSK